MVDTIARRHYTSTLHCQDLGYKNTRWPNQTLMEYQNIRVLNSLNYTSCWGIIYFLFYEVGNTQLENNDGDYFIETCLTCQSCNASLYIISLPFYFSFILTNYGIVVLGMVYFKSSTLSQSTSHANVNTNGLTLPGRYHSLTKNQPKITAFVMSCFIRECQHLNRPL